MFIESNYNEDQAAKQIEILEAAGISYIAMPQQGAPFGQILFSITTEVDGVLAPPELVAHVHSTVLGERRPKKKRRHEDTHDFHSSSGGHPMIRAVPPGYARTAS